MIKKDLSTKHTTRETGNRGEQIAQEYLREKKYTIIATNYRTRVGEIDIIAESPAGVLVFVEVKSLAVPSSLAASEARIFPEEHMTERKYRKVVRVSEQFCLEHKLQNREARIDLIAIEIGEHGANPKIRHLENIAF